MRELHISSIYIIPLDISLHPEIEETPHDHDFLYHGITTPKQYSHITIYLIAFPSIRLQPSYLILDIHK